ncbi:serine/threonine-protein kinase [Limnoglobus roseus]|uniref:serine/threonine-protein kinase n=1 Tax=Limnoglobus roseus TaxID=2598579 RepID=UPI00143CC6DF|nr:serine/threonine-protein kinase [Limnoglobus roseus]
MLTRLRTTADLPDNSGECAEQLIQQGVLTRFQSKQLLAGKFRGFVLGPYRLLDQIGKGGMGTVYLGEHATLKRRVAVKVLARELAENKISVERFLREARSASALTHGNIVRVHHVGQAVGTHYIVMEYVDGVTLEQVVDRKGPFSATEAAQIAVQAAAGLQHAHERGFVHRDIKPENLMITKNGTVKVLDMGLTKSIQSSSDNLTGVLNSKAILGTIDYLSPEQGLQSDVDARSDIYSLGATLFTLLTGHSPYDGVPAQQKLMQHQFGKVPLLSEFRSDLPEGLTAVVAKMMAKQPGERFQTVAEVADALMPWTADGGRSANITLPSRVMANPNAANQSQTPTIRDAAGKTSSDVPPQPAQPPAAPKVKGDFEELFVVGSPRPVVARPGIPPKVWGLLVILGVSIGLGAAIAAFLLG